MHQITTLETDTPKKINKFCMRSLALPRITLVGFEKSPYHSGISEHSSNVPKRYNRQYYKIQQSAKERDMISDKDVYATLSNNNEEPYLDRKPKDLVGDDAYKSYYNSINHFFIQKNQYISKYQIKSKRITLLKIQSEFQNRINLRILQILYKLIQSKEQTIQKHYPVKWAQLNLKEIRIPLLFKTKNLVINTQRCYQKDQEHCLLSKISISIAIESKNKEHRSCFHQSANKLEQLSFKLIPSDRKDLNQFYNVYHCRHARSRFSIQKIINQETHQFQTCVRP